MRNIFLVLLVIIFTVEINGQTISGNLEGKISYLSSQNVYVKFNSTAGISVGDTLFIQSNGGLLPALTVNNMSSISCICTPVSTIKLSVADLIIARVITKEKNTFSWKVGYKGDITTIQESIDNEDELQNFMMAVSDSRVILSKLIISLSYFLIVAVLSFFLYKKNKKILKDGAIVVILASIIALYIAIDASFDLSIVLQDAKFHYLRILFSLSSPNHKWIA